MIKFNENVNTFLIILITSFYFNKSFYLRISFNLNTTNYETTRARIKARKINDIITKITEFLIFNRK